MTFKGKLNFNWIANWLAFNFLFIMRFRLYFVQLWSVSSALGYLTLFAKYFQANYWDFKMCKEFQRTLYKHILTYLLGDYSIYPLHRWGDWSLGKRDGGVIGTLNFLPYLIHTMVKAGVWSSFHTDSIYHLTSHGQVSGSCLIDKDHHYQYFCPFGSVWDLQYLEQCLAHQRHSINICPMTN